MFNRVRSYTNDTPHYHHLSVVDKTLWNAGGGFGCADPLLVTNENSSTNVLASDNYGKGVISDVVLPRPRYFRGDSPLNRRVPRLVKPVVHDRKKVIPARDSVSFVHELTWGGCGHVRTRTTTSTPLAYNASRGYAYSLENIIDGIPDTTAGYTFTGVDWFSMVSEFNEGIDSLIPSSFFAGESFAEGGIFIDAIRLVVSPKKFVSGLIKNAKRRRLSRLPIGAVWNHYKGLLVSGKRRARSYELDQLADDMGIPLVGVKDGINAHLLYKFGVKPAIHDIRSTVEAHSNVESKLLFLNKNRGRYVPIRVRRVTGYSSYDLPPDPYVYEGVTTHLQSSKTVNVLFGHGRIRTDINEASRWRAYAEYFGLNKVVGTAWELLPFSFVVDWFTNAQERINELTRVRLGEGPFVNLTAMGHSVKNVLTWGVYWTPGYNTALGMTSKSPDSPVKAFDIEVSHYERYPGIPETSGVVDMSTLGLFHGITGTELLLQKFL